MSCDRYLSSVQIWDTDIADLLEAAAAAATASQPASKKLRKLSKHLSLSLSIYITKRKMPRRRRNRLRRNRNRVKRRFLKDNQQDAVREFEEAKPDALRADIRMISGCEDCQTSADVSCVGDFHLPDPAGRAGGACTR